MGGILGLYEGGGVEGTLAIGVRGIIGTLRAGASIAVVALTSSAGFAPGSGSRSTSIGEEVEAGTDAAGGAGAGGS